MTSVSERDSQGAVRPLSSTEALIASLWQEVLQLPDLPTAHDNFFALGGDSMTMTMLEFRINEELSIDVPAGMVLEAPSLRELSRLVDKARGGPAGRIEPSGSAIT